MARKEIIANCGHNETRVAILEDGQLQEIFVERESTGGTAGNIYKGRVNRVLPGMQSAFVNIGLARDGFLYVSDVLPDIDAYTTWLDDDDDSDDDTPKPQRRQSRRSRESQKIDKLLSRGQEILVQISKAPLGTKGARITTNISLPGRYLVYMPSVDHVGVSRKIEDRAERHRLKRIAQKARQKGMGGFIVRTAGVGRNEQEFADDMRFLHELWEELKRRSDQSAAPAPVHRDLSVLLRLLRDLFTTEYSRVVIDDETEYERAKRFLQAINPAVADRIQRHRSDRPIFDQFEIEQQIQKALESKVWLQSGAYLVINQTEALVAIDINTGKYVGKRRLEDTVLQTNVEAVREIVRQIRLRDLGGIIVIDFIDMEEAANRRKVVEVLQEELDKDRAKTQLLQISEFGLVELTRQRVKQSLENTLTQECPYCHSSGRVKSADTICLEILREVNRLRKQLRGRDVVVRANPVIDRSLRGDNRSVLQGMREIVQAPVNVVADQMLHQEQFEVANL
jgi:ribonuclease G